MAMDGFEWEQMGSDGKGWAQRSTDGFRWTSMGSDGLRWVRMGLWMSVDALWMRVAVDGGGAPNRWRRGGDG